MTRHFLLPSFEASAIAAMLIDTARCWREARDGSLAVQPCLFRALDIHDCSMLAPVLESLCLFYEGALGRSLAVGDALSLSDDEILLIALLEGSESGRSLNCPQRAAEALDLALGSTRIMLALALVGPGASAGLAGAENPL